MINSEEQNSFSNENLRYEITQNSDEWKMVEFHLKSSISFEVKIDKIISVKNTLTYNQFESISSTHLWSYGWYNLKGEDYETSMKEMREKSFKIPENGANFKVGAIFDSSNSNEVQSVYVLCKIIIGKSFCRIKQEGEKETPPIELEPPYESYMYCCPEQSAKSQKMSWSMTKPYSYYIKNKNYIEPLYTVFFTHIDSFLINMKSKYMCAQCKIKEAIFYCPYCINYYCNDCKNLIHYGNVTENNVKNVFQHKDFVKLQYTTRPGKCSVHHDRDSEYFCEECKRTICGYCRFKGGHSKGLQSQHQLEDIYLTFAKTNNQNQDYENEKKNGITSVKKITDHIKIIGQKMINHQNEINKDFDEHKKNMQELAKLAKIEVFEYISHLREIKRNILYFREYFTEREKYLLENKNYPELAFIWSIHEEIINEYLNNMDELRKVDLGKLSDKLLVNMPNVLISKESFGFNKTKIQTEVDNKRNIQKNDGFEQRQKDENYSILEKTRNLILKIREKRRLEREQIVNEKVKEDEINDKRFRNSSIEEDKNISENTENNNSEEENTTNHSIIDTTAKK